MIHNLNKDSLEDCKRKLGITYFILQTEQPLTDYEKVLELDEMNKVPVLKGFCSQSECSIFVDYLGEKLADFTLNFLSVHWDGSLGSTVKESRGRFMFSTLTPKHPMIQWKSPWKFIKSDYNLWVAHVTSELKLNLKNREEWKIIFWGLSWNENQSHGSKRYQKIPFK